MSALSCLKFGTAIGSVGGLISSAYYSGLTERGNKKDHPATFGAGMFSVGCLLGCPVIGASAGLGYWGLHRTVKYLRTTSKSTQIAALTLVGSAIAIKGAHTLGKIGK